MAPWNVCVVKIKVKLDLDGQIGRQILTQSTFLELQVCATTQNENASAESWCLCVGRNRTEIWGLAAESWNCGLNPFGDLSATKVL